MTEIIEIFAYILIIISILFTIYLLIDYHRFNKEMDRQVKEFDDFIKKQFDDLLKPFTIINSSKASSKIIIDGDNMKEIRKEE